MLHIILFTASYIVIFITTTKVIFYFTLSNAAKHFKNI